MPSARLPPADSGNYPDDLELILLQIVHRHGERTPVRKRLTQLFPAVWEMCQSNTQMFATIQSLQGKQYGVPLQRLVDTEVPGKAPRTLPAGACYYGQLTHLGRASMAALGARLREIYIDRLHFLPDIYEDSAISLRSSDYQRTQESVSQLITAGLYPPEKRPDDFVLKIRTRDPMSENLYMNPYCYRLREITKESRKQVNELCKEKFASLSEKLKNYVDGVSLDSHPSANGILDTLAAAKAHGFDLPEEVNDQVMNDLENIVVLEYFHAAIHSQEARRLGVGRLLGEIRDRMQARVDGSDKSSKLFVYSGHDTTVGPVLINLGAYDMKWPGFSSAIIFELFKQKQGGSNWFGKKENEYVRVRYNDKVLELPGCAKDGDHHSNGDKSLCTLEAFKRIVKDQVPDDWASECKAK
ncbi:histidine phosphatase superfamily [Dichotomocladium elegans]|nr:histidine phosphatase superfamily [Dichotomocladium elegans]